MHQVSVVGSTNEILKLICLPESVKLEIENEKVTFKSDDEKSIYDIKENIANILSNVIENKYSKLIIDDIIESSYYDFTDDDKENLFSDMTDRNFFGGSDLIREKLSDFLSNANSVSVDGFVKFRLGEYRRLIKKRIDRYAEKIDAIREYDELLELLKVYIETLPCFEKKINLYINKSGGYTVFSKNWTDITEKCIKNLADADDMENASFDEILLSVIIAAAPQEIVIHNHSFCKNRELINTIMKLFEGRVSECKGCNFCR